MKTIKATIGAAALLAAVNSQAVQVFHAVGGSGLVGGAFANLALETPTSQSPVAHTAIKPYESATFYASEEPEFFALLHDGQDQSFLVQTFYTIDGLGGGQNGGLESEVFGTPTGTDFFGSGITLDRITVTITGNQMHVRGFTATGVPDGGATAGLLGLGSLGLALAKRRH